MNSGAYLCEIIRSGIQSIDGGQTEAARSLGLTQGQNLRFIILPQAIKNILPAIGNEFVTIIKESAITYTIGVQDIMAMVQAIRSASFIIMEPLLVATGLYFCLCFPLSKLIAYIERRMSVATGDKLIQVRDLKKYYNRGAIKALDGVTVDIDRGDVMVVIGPSGSGKSTFLRSLNLLEMPTGGSIIFDGVDITKPKTKTREGKLVKVDIDQHRQKMGMVFQHFNLFPHMTIMDNMTPGPHPGQAYETVPTRRKRPRACWSGWAWETGPARTPSSSPAARSSGSPSSGH